VRFAKQDLGMFDFNDWENARPEDLKLKLKDRIKNKVTDTVEELEVKMLERRRRRHR
jgi:hypothetical protein